MPGRQRGARGPSRHRQDALDVDELSHALQQRSVLIEPGRPFFSSADCPTNFYRIAYSSIPAERIAEGISRIAAGLRG